MSEAARIRSLEQQNAALRESVDILKEEVLLHKNAIPDAQWLPDDALKMPLKEISVCRAFLRRRTPTAEYIYNTLYGLHECDIALNSVQTHISKLRKNYIHLAYQSMLAVILITSCLKSMLRCLEV